MGYVNDPEVCPTCGYNESKKKTKHNHTCEKIIDSPFTDRTCPMCGEKFDSYTSHLRDCPAGK